MLMFGHMEYAGNNRLALDIGCKISKVLYKMYHTFSQLIDILNLVFGYIQRHQNLTFLYILIKLYVFLLFISLCHYKWFYLVVIVLEFS